MKMTWGPVTQLIFLPRLFPIDCYLIEEKDGITLIDAGMPFVAKKIFEEVAAAGKPLTRILLTHAHEDHIGAVPWLKQKFPDAAIGLSRREAMILEGNHSPLEHEPQTPLKGGIPKKPAFVHDFVFDDQQRIGSLTAIACPGHTPGHMAFLEPETNTLIAGDAFQSKGGLAVSGRLKWAFPFPAMATWHTPTAIASARKLLKLKPSRLLVGHGYAIENPSPLIDQAIQDAERWLDRRNNK